MNTSRIVSYAHYSTEDVPFTDQFEYWNASNTNSLIGLKTSSLHLEGIQCEMTCVKLPELGIANIIGNDHMIERDEKNIRNSISESIFACLIISGKAYFVQKGKCLLLEPGEIIIYDTRIPYQFGFLTEMQQYLIDIPTNIFSELCKLRIDQLPLQLSNQSKSDKLFATNLSSTIRNYFINPWEQDGACFFDDIRALISTTVINHIKGTQLSWAHHAYLKTAKHYIANNLADPDLSTQHVATAVGISLRHLNRLFHLQDQSSVTDYIWTLRLERSYTLLHDLNQQKVTIGEIAYRLGFSSQSHFNRAIKKRYGMTPGKIRESGL